MDSQNFPEHDAAVDPLSLCSAGDGEGTGGGEIAAGDGGGEGLTGTGDGTTGVGVGAAALPLCTLRSTFIPASQWPGKLQMK